MAKRKYYRTLAEAERHRGKGERIYYKPEYGYYIVRPRKRKRSFWDFL